MRRFKEVIGLPVLSYNTGKRLATVSEVVLFEPDQRRVLGFLLDTKTDPTAQKAVRFSAIKAIGRDAVIVEEESAVVPSSEFAGAGEAFQRKASPVGLRMFTEDGQDLGTIEDVSFDEATGEVQGFEVSGGLLATMRRGRLFIPMPATMKIGQELVFVPSETLEQAQTTQGIPSGLGEARSGGEELLKRMGQELEKFGDMAVQAAAEQQKRFVVGRVADRSVAAPDGTLIVSQGDTIDEQMALDAERKGVLGDLALAAGASLAKDVIEGLRGEARRIFSQPRKTAGRVEVIDVSGPDESEDSRIERAIGKPAQRIVVDREQSVILNTGEMVTHEKIEHARRAGVLEELLNAVSREEPRFTEDERHRHTPGEVRYKRAEEGEQKLEE